MMLFALSSCRVRLHVPNTTTPTEPFVQLKDGEKFKGLSVERNSGLFVKDKIFIGDTSFKSKDVAFYSTGHNNYANVGRKTFATQVADGKINLYSYLYTTTTTSMNGHGGMSTSTHQHINYYVQKGMGVACIGAKL